MTRAGSEDGTAGGGGAAEPARENSGGGRAARLAAGGLDALAAGRKGALAEPLHGAFGTAVVHAADGCEGAPHRSHTLYNGVRVRKDPAVHLMVQDPPVRVAIELLQAGRGLRGEQDVIVIEPRAAEPNGQLQYQDHVLVQFGPTAGVNRTNDVPEQGERISELRWGEVAGAGREGLTELGEEAERGGNFPIAEGVGN